MYKSSSENELELAKFGEYLLKERIVNEKHAPYYVRWVRRFLAEVPPKGDISLEDRMGIFADNLKGNVEDWQVVQAERAIRVYFSNFAGGSGWKDSQTTSPLVDQNGCVKRLDVIAAARRLMQLRHYSYRTEQTYVFWIGRFFDHLTERESSEMKDQCIVDSARIKDFLARLAIKDRVSASTQNQAFSALLFMCRDVLRVEMGDMAHTVRAKRKHHLPVVLSQEEAKSVLAKMAGTAKVMAQLIYGGGLRVSECCRLRVKDLDFGNNLLFVRDGKGGKDRSTILAESLKPDLTAHLERVRKLHEADLSAGAGAVAMPDALARKYPNANKEWCWQYVFPSKTLSTDPRSGKVRRHHVSDTAVQRAVYQAVRAAGIAKPVSVHSLRHSFATSLLLHNVDIRQIQEYLGHANVETTMIYTHVVKDMRNPATSPLDMLAKAG